MFVRNILLCAILCNNVPGTTSFFKRIDGSTRKATFVNGGASDIIKGEIKKRQSNREEAMEDNTINHEYLEICRGKCFLASKAEAKPEAVTNNDGNECISEARRIIETKRGAKMGVGITRTYLQPAGFRDNVPLGAGSIVPSEGIDLSPTFSEVGLVESMFEGSEKYPAWSALCLY